MDNLSGSYRGPRDISVVGGINYFVFVVARALRVKPFLSLTHAFAARDTFSILHRISLLFRLFHSKFTDFHLLFRMKTTRNRFL